MVDIDNLKSICEVVKVLLDTSILRCYIFDINPDTDYNFLVMVADGVGLTKVLYIFTPVTTGILVAKNSFLTTPWRDKIPLIRPVSKSLQLIMQGVPIKCIPTLDNTKIFSKVKLITLKDTPTGEEIPLNTPFDTPSESRAEIYTIETPTGSCTDIPATTADITEIVLYKLAKQTTIEILTIECNDDKADAIKDNIVEWVKTIHKLVQIRFLVIIE